MTAIRHITLPQGFLAAGVACGIKQSGKEDLTIIAGEQDVAAAVLTTRNQVFGEPVRYCRQTLPKGFGRIRGIVVNSGNSNVCTGRRGFRDACTMATLTAKRLGVPADRVLVASTGIIGHLLPMDKVRRGIARAADLLGRDHDTEALRGIMTTDTREKYAVVQTRIEGRPVTVAGIVKGVGMLSPSLATMISVITTDAAVAPASLHRVLGGIAGRTYNAVTVDSDTSTSDTVLAMASGRAGNTPLTERSAGMKVFASAMEEVCLALTRAVAFDGEGATKIIEITVCGARSDADAAIAAKAVANSPLFKCAVHGADPNWGRIAAALGKSAAKVNPDTLRIAIGGVGIFARGAGRKFDARKVSAHLAGTEVSVECDLGLGTGRYTAYTCDLSHEYVTINADYHT